MKILSEQHPREQGLKLDTWRHERQLARRLSEQHPREQGLKPYKEIVDAGANILSEQHPREQGLKLGSNQSSTIQSVLFQSNIQENKDWNRTRKSWMQVRILLFQSNIQENKDWNRTRKSWMQVRIFFQSNIQENKDWNYFLFLLIAIFIHPFRATSKRTRIETKMYHKLPRFSQKLSEQHPREQGLKLWRYAAVEMPHLVFQSNIQENKDWNRMLRPPAGGRRRAFRATSKRTRIET